MIAKEKKQAIIKEYGRCEGDTGYRKISFSDRTSWIKKVIIEMIRKALADAGAFSNRIPA